MAEDRQFKKTPFPSRKRIRSKTAAAALWAIPLAAGFPILLSILGIFRDAQPADFRMAGRTLVIVNKAGRELWRYDAGLEKPAGERFYRNRFRGEEAPPENGFAVRGALPLLLIQDLDGDGRKEVLFAPRDAESGEGADLVLIDGRGAVRWVFPAGLEARIGTRPCPPDYQASFIETRDFDRDGTREILFAARALREPVTRVVLLNPKKEILGEYWNSGDLDLAGFADLNRDGREEIILAGRNEEFRQPCLIVFEALAMDGCSPQGPEFRIAGRGRGSEIYALRFPSAPVGPRVNPGAAFTSMTVLKGGAIRLAGANSGEVYIFDDSLRLRAVVSELENERRPVGPSPDGWLGEMSSRRVSAAEAGRLVLYYDGAGKRWVDRPAMSNLWTN